MLILITYGVNTGSVAEKNRLEKVAKQYVNYGTQVQNSVLSVLDYDQYLK